MRLPVPPRARLLQSLLLLTLLLVAVCGMQKRQSPGTQPRSPLWKAQGNIRTSKSQQPEGMARSGSIPATPSSLSAKEPFGSNLQDGHQVVPLPRSKKALSVPENSESELRDAKEEEDGAQKEPEMSNGVKQGPGLLIPLISGISDLYGCETSVSCRSILLILYVNFMRQDLPNCPCTYLSEAQEGVVSLFDQHVGSNVTWRDASSSEELPPNSPAHFCLRSVLSPEANTLASQHCCYDAQNRLLTRGDGAGTPELISPDFSPLLHVKLDDKPWSQCKEEWPSHQVLFPPNNGLSCPENPPEDLVLGGILG